MRIEQINKLIEVNAEKLNFEAIASLQGRALRSRAKIAEDVAFRAHCILSLLKNKAVTHRQKSSFGSAMKLSRAIGWTK